MRGKLTLKKARISDW